MVTSINKEVTIFLQIFRYTSKYPPEHLSNYVSLENIFRKNSLVLDIIIKLSFRIFMHNNSINIIKSLNK